MMPLEFRVEHMREILPSGAHGPVHVEVHPKGQPRRHRTLCGLPTEGMRKQGTPFRDWAQVLCDDCARALTV